MFQSARATVLVLLCTSAIADPVYLHEGGNTLPNGWKITPAGQHLSTSDTVLNLVTAPDGAAVIGLACGHNVHELIVLDPATNELRQNITLPTAWYGMAWSRDGKQLFVSGGNSKLKDKKTAPIYVFDYADAKLATKRSELRDTLPQSDTHWSGLAAHPSKPLLYAANLKMNKIVAFDTSTGEKAGEVAVGETPYDLQITPDGATLYCSNIGDDTLSILDTETLKVTDTFPCGDNPNDMVLTPDGRLFVCSSNDNTVLAFDTATRQFTERIVTSMHPKAPEGSTPNALAYDQESGILYVANANNNNVAILNIEDPGESDVLGFIPTGWYPAALALSSDAKQLFIGTAMGTGTWATPNGPRRPGAPGKNDSIKHRMRGSISLVDVTPEPTKLAQWTRQSIENCTYDDALLTAAKPSPTPSVVPSEVGIGSPIKHVIYIIKENRTYDQVLGDVPRGNGDPNLCLFGAEVTPNQHKMVEEFVLFDNLYCDAEVSVDGHSWSNAAYATDYTEKAWPAKYGGKSDMHRSPAMKPHSGYLWDQAAKKGITYRNYGEFAMRQSDGESMKPSSQDLVSLHGHVAPKYLGWGARDTENAAEFLREFDEYVANFDNTDPEKRLPNLIVLALPEDHTVGTTPGKPTPRASVASNDLAFGQIVDRVSHSPYWSQTAIFAIQDDAQDGSDHVDARRTTGYLITPYAKRHHVDSTHYSTSGMLRTIELLLGLDPMSQFDASATPMYAALSDTPDPTPFTHVPAIIDINERNTKDAPGASASAAMDFSDYDRAPMFALNQILWQSIKGEEHPMPLPIHRYHISNHLLAQQKTVPTPKE